MRKNASVRNQRIPSALFFALLLSVSALFAETLTVNQRTARRYAELSKQEFEAGHLASASEYQEMAAAYDADNSDVWYLKALLGKEQDVPRKTLVSIYRIALETDTWVLYSRDICRLSLAELYTGMGRWDESLELLDQPPALLTADAQYLRAICLYNCKDAAQKRERAREVILHATRIYPRDGRFLEVFFDCEPVAGGQENPGFESGAEALGEKLLQNVLLYTDAIPRIALGASRFLPEEEARRLLRNYQGWVPVSEREPFFAVQALRTGLLDGTAALGNYLSLSQNKIDYPLLKTFAAVLGEKDPDAFLRLSVFLSSFTGTVLYDTVGNHVTDMSVSYANGRPMTAVLDEDNDDEYEWICTFNYGIPRELILVREKAIIRYARYPAVTSVELENGITWELLADSFEWPCLMVEASPLFAEEKPFYEVIRNETLSTPSEGELRSALWQVTQVAIPVSADAYENATPLLPRVTTYTLRDGTILAASCETMGGADCRIVFAGGVPVLRTFDLDCDGANDLVQFFSPVSGEPAEEMEALTAELYGPLSPTSTVYISGVEVSLEDNGAPSYRTLFAENGDETTFWGEFAAFSETACAPAENTFEGTSWSSFKDGTTVSRFHHPVRHVPVQVTMKDGLPVSVQLAAMSTDLLLDSSVPFYWFYEEEGDLNELHPAAVFCKNTLALDCAGASAFSEVVEYGGKRIFALKAGSLYFGELLDD